MFLRGSPIKHLQTRGQAIFPCLFLKIAIINSTPDCAHVGLVLHWDRLFNRKMKKLIEKE